jgi:L-lactate dehydrogenase complex protein LldG
MSSREKILAQVLKHQPLAHSLPEIGIPPTQYPSMLEQFSSVIKKIGGTPIEVDGWKAIGDYVKENYGGRIVNTIQELDGFLVRNEIQPDPHLLEDVQVALIQGHFGVAENGAIWVTETQLGDRALPFISENIAFVIDRKNIVTTMHAAYEKINSISYNFGTFIAGPSKTADIEQSLVIGAHGPKSMIVFIL